MLFIIFSCNSWCTDDEAISPLQYFSTVQGAVELLANQVVHVISPNEIESYYRKSTDVEKQDIASSIKRK